jgi:hypothetical protein
MTCSGRNGRVPPGWSRWPDTGVIDAAVALRHGEQDDAGGRVSSTRSGVVLTGSHIRSRGSVADQLSGHSASQRVNGDGRSTATGQGQEVLAHNLARKLMPTHAADARFGASDAQR